MMGPGAAAGPGGAPSDPAALLQMLQQFEASGGNLNDVSPDLAALMRNVKQSKGQAVADEAPTEDIVPDPGFVVKTVEEGTGRKVFINMCGSAKVAAPGNWANGRMPEEVEKALDNVDNLTDKEAETLRFPLSMGAPKRDLDKKAEPCTTIDCVLNGDVVKQCAMFRPLKVFIIELALNWIGHKHGMVLDKRYKLPKMKYKGDEVESQRIRVDRKPLVAEVRDIPDEPQFPLVTKKPKQPVAPAGQQQASSSSAPGAAAAASAAAAAGAAAGASSFSFAGAKEQAAQQQQGQGQAGEPPYSVEYMGRPVEWVEITVELPAPSTSAPGPAGAQQPPPPLQPLPTVEVCGSSVFFTGLPGHARELEVRLPFAVASTAPAAAADADAGGPSGGSAAGEAPGPVVAELVMVADESEAAKAKAAAFGPRGQAPRRRRVLRVRLPYRPLGSVVAQMEAERPFGFGQLAFASEGLLELEP